MIDVVNRIIIQLSPETQKELDDAAKEDGLSRAAFVREAVLMAVAERRRKRELQMVIDSYRSLPQQEDEIFPSSAQAWPD